MYLIAVLKQAQSNTMDWCVAPALVKEATRAVQVVKVVLIHFATPEIHISDLKVAPEMTGRVAVSFLVVQWPVGRVNEPLDCVVGVQVLGVFGDELKRLWPERLDRFGRVVDIDDEAVGLVVIFHVAEHVVVNVAEETICIINTTILKEEVVWMAYWTLGSTRQYQRMSLSAGCS